MSKSSSQTTFSARAVGWGDRELGRIEDVPFGNIAEFVEMHLTGNGIETRGGAQEIVIRRAESDE